MDKIDARILELIQREFPLSARPFDLIASMISTTPEDALSRIRAMKSDGVIRQISAIFDSAALGYVGALIAFKVADDMLEPVASAVSAHPGVSHCYARNADYNLWFTLTVGPDDDLDTQVRGLAVLDGVQSHIVLPAVKVFKIGVFLKMTEGDSPGLLSGTTGERQKPFNLSPEDRAAVRALQTDLPLTEAPFTDQAREAGLSVDELLERGRAFLDTGAMRRFAAVLRHREAGYKFNAMVCWRVAPDMIDAMGSKFAQHPVVSHCYERPTFPDWPYALYTMVHARSKDELDRMISELVAASQNSEHLVLETVAEFKKTRVQYFRAEN
ncbi:MAG: siroheme decarboxylase subunit beta [Armatimonadota bacterium]